NLDLTAIQFHLGPEGFLSYLLPVLLLVSGLLIWLTPQQRFFYAIIGTLTAVYALIGLNLGGFLLGTLIGMIGGGVGFARQPHPAGAGAHPARRHSGLGPWPPLGPRAGTHDRRRVGRRRGSDGPGRGAGPPPG